ncbi:dynein regulatory complex protein 10-like [Clytia hemisphaerica]|uniref:Dynein regulatory complex protein 10 n=1 Tax=Clytia hemisphaerica TaxID=252671 RepID=A0A7M6DNE2_9CNID
MAIAATTIDMASKVHQMTNGMEEIQIQPLQNKHTKRKEEEINRLFDASRRKLDSLDSQRIIGVLDDFIRKTEIVTLLPFIVENLDRYSIMLGSDLCYSIKEYDRVQTTYSKACATLRKLLQQLARQTKARGEYSGLSAESDEQSNMIEEAQTNLGFVSANLSDNIRTVLRKFKMNPSALQSIRIEFRERASEANALIDQLNQLHEMVFSRLVTTPNEEIEKHKLTIQMMTREKKARSLITKLDQELKTERAAKDNLIHQKNETVRKLKSNISMIEHDSEVSNRKLVTEAQKVEIAEIKNSDGKRGKLQQEVIQLKQRLQTQVSSHKDSELTLRKRKYKIETEVENWIQKYDSEMAEKQDDIDDLTDIYNDEKKQLQELEERFKTLEEKHTTIIEERRIAAERREKAERELRVMVRAATLLQAMWRAYRCRKALKQKAKGKGKKGKGKGKKKR